MRHIYHLACAAAPLPVVWLVSLLTAGKQAAALALHVAVSGSYQKSPGQLLTSGPAPAPALGHSVFFLDFPGKWPGTDVIPKGR